MNNTLYIFFISFVYTILILSVFFNIKSIISPTEAQKKEKEKQKQINLKLKENRKAKHDSSNYPVNTYVDDWVNKVLNDGVIKVYQSNNKYIPSEKDRVFYSGIMTEHYHMLYWCENKFYAYAHNGSILIRNTNQYITWNNNGISKKTRYHLYQVEEGFKALNNGEIPMLYSEEDKKVILEKIILEKIKTSSKNS